MKSQLRKINTILKDPSPKKSFFQIVKEVFTLSLKYKRLPNYYVQKFMYRKDSGDYRDYLTPNETAIVRFSPKFHRIEYLTLLKNKLASALYFEQCKLPIPMLTGYNVNNLFFADGNKIKIESESVLIDFFYQIMKKTGKKSLFLKDIAESGGVGCFLITEETLESTVKKIMPYLLSGSFIHQETIKQHHDISRIYASSLNTLRFETFIDWQGKHHIVCVYMRFGMNGNFVDNAFSGGMYISINPENGRFHEKGYQKFKGSSGGKCFQAHPDTDFIFKDYPVPYFKEACDLVRLCLKFVPDRYLGWDIAISENGPILIEGNGSPFLAEAPYGGYRNHKLAREILTELNLQ
ncbi:MAG TPA: hypothetical protein ENH91_10970 [Leeuwenhoekiella sp.]|nr:hypothetical protein [Leeuwenhoekiella sp.]